MFMACFVLRFNKLKIVLKCPELNMVGLSRNILPLLFKTNFLLHLYFYLICLFLDIKSIDMKLLIAYIKIAINICIGTYNLLYTSIKSYKTSYKMFFT